MTTTQKKQKKTQEEGGKMKKRSSSKTTTTTKPNVRPVARTVPQDWIAKCCARYPRMFSPCMLSSYIIRTLLFVPKKICAKFATLLFEALLIFVIVGAIFGGVVYYLVLQVQDAVMARGMFQPSEVLSSAMNLLKFTLHKSNSSNNQTLAIG
jgi:hypothetical protein